MEQLLSLYTTYTLLIWYLIAINVMTFFTYSLDKFFAISQKRRVSEKTLLILALFGGSLGALGAIQLFRHKTRKNSFLIWFILIFLVQLIALFYLIQTVWMKVG